MVTPSSEYLFSTLGDKEYFYDKPCPKVPIMDDDDVPRFISGVTFNQVQNGLYSGKLVFSKKQWESQSQKSRNVMAYGRAQEFYTSKKKAEEEKYSGTDESRYTVSPQNKKSFTAKQIVKLCSEWDGSPLTEDRFAKMDAQTIQKVIDKAWEVWYPKWKKEYRILTARS